MNNKISLIILFVAVLLASCSSQKSMTYMRNVNANAADSINKSYKVAEEPTITIGDQLLITISALDPEAAAPFNLPAVTYMGQSASLSSTPNLQYYTVDVNGNIQFPILGTLHMNGLKKSEAIALLKSKLAPLLKEPVVMLRMINYSVTLLGEVNRPGRYQASNEQLTILEALGMAGDLTAYGMRDNVLITREKDGKLEFARINLNDPNLFASPYFHLQQNDVIYVSPNKVRAISAQNLSLYFSMISTLASTAAVIVSAINVSNTTTTTN